MKELKAYQWLDNQMAQLQCLTIQTDRKKVPEYLKYQKDLDDVSQLIEVGNGSLKQQPFRHNRLLFEMLDYWSGICSATFSTTTLPTGATPITWLQSSPSYDRRGYYDVMRSRRVYSTQTRNLKLEVYANGQIMGSELNVTKGGTVSFEINASDPEEKNIQNRNHQQRRQNHCLKKLWQTG